MAHDREDTQDEKVKVKGGAEFIQKLVSQKGSRE